MKNGLISIIVPVYNVHCYLDQCLVSLQNQTYSNIEIILVDDGSTDGSGEKCDQYAEKDNRIIVIHKNNGGLSDARNAGLNVARGEYIGFVDSDDWVSETMFESLYSICISRNAEVAGCGYYKVFINGMVPVNPHKAVYSSREALKKLIENDDFQDHVCMKLFHSSLFDNIRFPRNCLYEDTRTTIHLFERLNKAAFSSEPLYYYRQRKGSIAKGGFTLSRLELISAIEETFRDYYHDHEICKAFEERLLRTKCILFREMLISESVNKNGKNRDLMSEYFSELRKNRKIIIASSKYSKSVKAIAVLSPLGLSTLRVLFNSKMMHFYYRNKYDYYE